MTKRSAAVTLLAACGLLALVAAGCGPDTELGGTPVPNVSPNTQVTGRPPDLLESSFIVAFNWTGFDPDGRVRGYQWKLSNNGVDGISVQDTLTMDPVTGDTLNPWHFTTSTDTVLLVSAELDSFPRDPEGLNRSYQTHSFFVRAIDEEGAVDPSPAYVSFTATTLLPTVAVVGPTVVVNQAEPAQLPPSVAFIYSGSDPDFALGLPTRIRFLWKRALMPAGDEYANSRVEVAENMDFFVNFSDSAWSPWEPFRRNEELRRKSFENQPKLDEQLRAIYYVFAAQVQDTAGAVSIDRTYGLNVNHVWIRDTAPLLTIFEPFLGTWSSTGTASPSSQDIAAGQPLNFSWGASAEAYAGTIVSYRYGWDVQDPTNPTDPNWALAPGNTPQHRRSPTASFSSGQHTLTIEVRDNSGQFTRTVFPLSVIQAPPPADQLPLLWVDDVYDRNSNAWVSQQGQPLNNDIYRDDFYKAALTGSGGVENFEIQESGDSRDEIDTEVESLGYRDIVRYKAVLWSGRLTEQSFIVRELAMYTNEVHPDYYVDRYNWLSAYQERIGNLLFASTGAMKSFLPVPDSGWSLPVVFQSHEGSPRGGLQDGYGVSFGRRILPDGTIDWIGESRYPYTTWGISVVDQVSPRTQDVIYNSDPLVAANTGRRSQCVGVKAVVLDDGFVERHMPAGVPFAQTIYNEPTIDWRDLQATTPAYYDNLNNTYEWGDEEFYDQVIVDRTTHWDRQMCANSPIDTCLEPMFRSLARFDWIRQRHLAKPDQYRDATSVAIPDNNPAGVTRTLRVTDHADAAAEVGGLDSLRVRVQINHARIGDLRLELTHLPFVVINGDTTFTPGLQPLTVVLKDFGTGGENDNIVGWYPTDFPPAESLTAFHDRDVFGTWLLRVIDNSPGTTGSVAAVTLEAWYDDPWPAGYYEEQLRNLCGRFALETGNTSARTNDVVVGVLSHKTAINKPSQVGDILWGFDPYRFDHDQMTEAIRWVLGEHFNLPMRP